MWSLKKVPIFRLEFMWNVVWAYVTVPCMRYWVWHRLGMGILWTPISHPTSQELIGCNSWWSSCYRHFNALSACKLAGMFRSVFPKFGDFSYCSGSSGQKYSVIYKCMFAWIYFISAFYILWTDLRWLGSSVNCTCKLLFYRFFLKCEPVFYS